MGWKVESGLWACLGGLRGRERYASFSLAPSVPFSLFGSTDSTAFAVPRSFSLFELTSLRLSLLFVFSQDASGQPLLDLFFYDPARDPDQIRAKELGGLMRPLRGSE